VQRGSGIPLLFSIKGSLVLKKQLPHHLQPSPQCKILLNLMLLTGGDPDAEKREKEGKSAQEKRFLQILNLKLEKRILFRKGLLRRGEKNKGREAGRVEFS